jgi:hypothetical protein
VVSGASPQPEDSQVIISEFLASNNNGLRDEDGACSDWIELFNRGTNTVNLEGWHLTDSAASLTKWRFPATNLPPNGFLLVFASGKDRALPGAPLHANFSLKASGDCLALVYPDGVTIALEFRPLFPEQFPNISYGIGQDVRVTTLLASNAPLNYIIPTNGALGNSWVAPSFNDADWSAGTNGLGYESFVPGFAVRNIRANVSVCDLATAEGVLAKRSQQAAVFTANPGVVNYMNTGGGSHFANDATFPGFSINIDENNFVLEAVGTITIPTSGKWTFGVNSDDGFRATIGTNEFSYPPPRSPGDTFGTFTLAAGDYPVRLVFYECGGGSEVEFFAAAGTYTSFSSAFRLVGDTSGLPVISLPTAAGNNSIRPLLRTDVAGPMAGRASSAYLRLPFTVANPGVFTTLTLRMTYNDGFIAWLNGVEVARRNAPAAAQWNSLALAPLPATNVLATGEIDLTSQLNLLQPGANVLAIHGLNEAANASRFFIRGEVLEQKLLGLGPHYFATPTPGAPNGAGFFAFVEDLKFTPGRGCYVNTNLFVTITSATPGTTIRYTLDGTLPNDTNGAVYAGPIPITNTTVLRAGGSREGFEPTTPEIHSYLFLDRVQRQSTNRNYAGSAAGNYTLDTNIALGALYAKTFTDDLRSVPTLSLVLPPEDFFGAAAGLWANPTGQGAGWERACSAEYLPPDGVKGFHVNCGLRVQGGVSRTGIPKHSLRLLFKTEYGPGKLDYDLYPESPVKEFDSLTLHAGFNDHWLWVGAPAQLLRDQWCRDTQNALSGYGAHGRYVHLYINGLYWGLYNLGEQTDASFAAHYLGGDKDEYDALNADQVVDGNGTAWNALFGLLGNGITSDLAYTNLAQYLDIPNFIDYLLMNFYAANTDWPYHNWKAARRRVPGAGFYFFSWDAEWVIFIGSDLNTDRTGITDGSPGRLYAALRAHPEFRRQFGDRAQKYLFNGGPLTPAACEARYRQRAREIDGAIVPETARWGGGYDRQTWLNEQNRLRTQWFPLRSAIVLKQLRNAGLFPQLDPPTFAPFGGLVPPGSALALTNPNPAGAVYYTTDGSDPRLWGGKRAASAALYQAPLVLTHATFLRARVLDGANWSALVEAMFYAAQDYRALAVTEIMYDPLRTATNAEEDLEFLELKNTGTNSLDLSGLSFTDGIAFAFPNGTQLAPGALFLLARSPAALQATHPGVVVNGVFGGRLDNAGERLTLEHVLGGAVFSFAYKTDPPWPLTPDGYGFSLVRADTGADPALASSWRPSAAPGGSPGAEDPPVSIPPVLINEVLTRAEPPRNNALELFNPAADPADVGGWFLTDDAAQPQKFRIPEGMVVPPGGSIVFTEADFNPNPGGPPSFALNSLGGSLYLFSGDAGTNLTGYSHGVAFGAAAPGVSFGRYVLSTGEEAWPAQVTPSLGAPNAGPRVGPVVINEIMYHPEPGYDEFIELKNISLTNIDLCDAAAPANPWKLEGVGLTFPPGVTVPAGSFLLLVDVDPNLFRAVYHVPAEVPILGPYPGLLNNAGERLRLERPDPRPGASDALPVPWVVVDDVRYGTAAPWPASADGLGPSLQRRAPEAYGNEPTNWFASGISPGAENLFNLPPLVSILSPANGAVFNLPGAFTLQVQADDPDCGVAKVEFFQDGAKLGEATNAPWTWPVAGLGPGAYSFSVKARDSHQSTATAAITVVVNPPPVGAGAGLVADYFDNIDFTGAKLTRVDPTINFDWGSGSPNPALGPDTFSARWTGKLEPRFTGRYTFYAVSDDGVRVWVDGKLIIDNWGDHAPTENSGGLDLVAGTRYDLRLDYYENGGGAVASLAWASTHVPREIIPTSQLYNSGRAPSLLLQPQSRIVRCGSNVVFGVVPDGLPPLACQWFFDGGALAGATRTNLLVTNAQPANSGNYWVLITNAQGAVTSRVATLTVADPPAFLLQPQSQTVLAGDTVRFQVAVAGTPPFGFRWRKGSLTLVPLGLGTDTLILTNVQLRDAGLYYAGVSNAVALSGISSAGALLTVLDDADADHLPDLWEAAHGLDPKANDANLDPDHDGLTNLQEYLAGTDPQDPASVLKIDALAFAAGAATVLFQAVSNKTYSILYINSSANAPWQKLADVPPTPTNRTLAVADPNALPPARFYRLVTPQTP